VPQKWVGEVAAMRLGPRLGAVLFATSIVSVLHAVPAAAVAVQHDIPAPPFAFNPCNGELVATTGELHLVAVFDPSDPRHTLFRANFADVKGVGLESGTQYVVAQSSQLHENFNQQGQDEFTVTSVLQVVSFGSTLNFDQTIVFHMVASPSGQTTTVTYGDSDCKGAPSA
jgi:hypothetical protein